MLTAKKIVVYFASMPIPNATPIASHHAARPVSRSLTSVSSKKAAAATTALSGVAIIEPGGYDQRQIEIKRGGRADLLVADEDCGRTPNRPTGRHSKQHIERPHAEFGVAEQFVPSRIRIGLTGGWL